ncbi:hypothetical protein [Lysobacter sp. A289]
MTTCLDAAPDFLLAEDAEDLISGQINAITKRCDEVCQEGGLSEVNRNLFRQRNFLNPSIFDQAPESLRVLGRPFR